MNAAEIAPAPPRATASKRGSVEGAADEGRVNSITSPKFVSAPDLASARNSYLPPSVRFVTE
jgi:hypothetical protein